jgi:hypothetical protein
MGLCKLKVQINYGLRRFHQGERKKYGEKYKDRRKIYLVSRKNGCAKEIFESIKGCKHPLIASGATPIESASHAPDEIKARKKKLKRREGDIFEPIVEKLSTIASGATPIGSTGHAPDDGKY